MAQFVKDIMNSSTVRVSPKESLSNVLSLMNEKRISHILVSNDECSLVGIISDRDIKKFSSPFAGSKLETDRDKATMNLPCEHFMSKNPVTVRTNDTVKTCVEIMLTKKINALPVSNDKGIQGIVTTTDLLKCFLSYL